MSDLKLFSKYLVSTILDRLKCEGGVVVLDKCETCPYIRAEELTVETNEYLLNKLDKDIDELIKYFNQKGG